MKGIEWIKLNTAMCEDETMRLIDSMELRYPAHYVWIRLLLQAGKTNDNGLIYLKKDVPYTKEMLSILFNTPIDIIGKVLDILVSFKMIEIYKDNIIKICNWEKHQNIEGMKRVREGNRERVKNFRERKKNENELLKKESLSNEEVLENASGKSKNFNKINKSKNCNGNVTLQKEKREKDNKNKKKNIDKEDIREDFSVNSEICLKGLKGNEERELKEIKGNEEGEIEENKGNEEGALKESNGNHTFKEFAELDVQASKIMKDLQKINVSIKGLTMTALREMLTVHGEKYIKMAMGKAIEKNKLNINYINGILNNWLREGYPKNYEGMEFNGHKSYSLSSIKEKPNLRFINFEAREYDYKDLERQLLGW